MDVCTSSYNLRTVPLLLSISIKMKKCTKDVLLRKLGRREKCLSIQTFHQLVYLDLKLVVNYTFKKTSLNQGLVKLNIYIKIHLDRIASITLLRELTFYFQFSEKEGVNLQKHTDITIPYKFARNI